MLAALCVTSNCLSTYRRLTHPVTASSLEPVNRLLKSRRYHPAINAAQRRHAAPSTCSARTTVGNHPRPVTQFEIRV